MKRLPVVNWLMNITGAEENEWLLCMEYVIYVRNHAAMKSFGWKTPLEMLTGITPDVSIIYYLSDVLPG